MCIYIFSIPSPSSLPSLALSPFLSPLLSLSRSSSVEVERNATFRFAPQKEEEAVWLCG